MLNVVSLKSGILISVGVSTMKSLRNVKRLPLKRTSLYTLSGSGWVVEALLFVHYDIGTVEGGRQKSVFVFSVECALFD